MRSWIGFAPNSRIASEHMLEKLHQAGVFAWLTQEGADTLANCFDLRVEELTSGAKYPVGQMIGCLLEGEAVFSSGGERRVLQSGELFGLNRQCRAIPGILTAGERCTAAWFHRDLVTQVCYGACWFHARLIEEINRALRI